MENHYDYSTYIRLMEKRGKEMFGNHFSIIEQDIPIVKQMLVYFLKDEINAKKINLSLKKGILLTGPVGSGKTSLMTLFRLFQPVETRFVIRTCRDISFEFIQNGYPVIHKYSRSSSSKDIFRPICFDDLGIEQNLKYFGNECNVMAEIILSRYDLFTFHNLITHITTNLNSSEIEEQYGSRVRSRMREMFNLISFTQESKDKRV